MIGERPSVVRRGDRITLTAPTWEALARLRAWEALEIARSLVEAARELDASEAASAAGRMWDATHRAGPRPGRTDGDRVAEALDDLLRHLSPETIIMDRCCGDHHEPVTAGAALTCLRDGTADADLAHQVDSLVEAVVGTAISVLRGAVMSAAGRSGGSLP